MRVFIKTPVITEKSLKMAAENNAYTFEVSIDAEKVTAKRQLEQLFGVKVVKVQSNVKLGRKVNFGKARRQGQRSHRKVMIFTLAEGNKIDMFTQQ
jgi:large subunit ribosomal protein L23